ncbi:hypothetical protein F5144DRAFT_548888 [Chaetomium tenue]|uniref:Uncharacterized protein n=1 Tax=Chaetomium tenue TaxID=1854479 RepID=A0ACB7P2K8_9PEZI|nr:hypothetical protein F5144DRAFT_548888 [Chaetomium globosum]
MDPPMGISIGIDIGVSTSGVSYCFVDRFGKAEGPPASVPLLAAQAHLQPTILSKQHNVWGTDAKQYDDKLTLLKLALLENELEGEPEHIRAVQQELNKISATGYDAITILADYIGMMWADARSKIQQAVAFRLGGQNVGLKSSLIFSIPAVWSERAAERMQKAIVKSGITVDASFIDLVLEPEAAALAVLPGLSKLKNGKAVVIADLGGGTVDFISYTLSPTTARRFNQCVAAEGRLLGDMFMKSALRSFIAEKVEGKLRIDIASLHQAGFEAQVKKVWRNACAFEKGAEDLREWSCPVVTNRQDGTEMPAVTIDGSDIVATFRSITKGILALTHSQIEAAEERQGSPQGIVVVGGFGLNSFLKEELRINFDKLVNFTDDAGLLAVKNGAAMYGVAKMAGESAANQQDDPVEGSARIDSRMTRRSYGVWAGTGPKDIVHWFISKNQTVGDHHDPIILPLAAFNARIDRDQPCAPIYSCGRKVTGLRSITSDIKVYKNPYQIRCLNPRAVDGVESLHLRPWLNDRQEIEFEVQDDLKGFFTVEKLK